MLRCFVLKFHCFSCKFVVRRKVVFLRSEEQYHSLSKKSIITQRARAFTLNFKVWGFYNLVLPWRVDSACTSFFGRAGSVGSQQFSFAMILTWCQFWLVSIIEMKKWNEIFAKIFFGSTPQIDGRMQCSFSEDAERWWKINTITQSSFCLLFCWFSPKFDRKMPRKFWKRPFYFGPYKTNFCRYSWLDLLYTKNLFA